jgi:hypothetical protein
MMRLISAFFPATLVTGLALLAWPNPLISQQPASVAPVAAAQDVPDAPQPQFDVAALEPPAQAPAQDSSSTPPAQQPAAQKSQHEKAEQQIKEQEQQRLVGVLPQFNISYRSDAVSMSASQKIKLSLRSATDPVAFAVAFVAAGYHEAMDDDKGFGWGIEGYGKRSGAAYLDAFDGNLIGNGILPAVLHQDPRYFRLGHGTVTHRLLYSLATNVICKHDNTGKWEPNYSNVGGNIVSGAISNLYYPSQDSGIGQTFTNGFIVTAEGGFGSIFDEFWPDISRKILHKDPTHGLDAQARAKDVAEKEARKQAKLQAQQDQKQK